MADKVKLGIIGYGHIGSQHGRAIRDGKCPQVNLTAVCDIDPARLELAKKTNGEDIQTFTDASELIHSGACEAVIIAVPHYLHPSMAIEAMETGLHVIVEKPAGVYTKQVEEMNAVAAKHPELVYCMDFNQRTNPLYKKVKDLIDSGDLGEMTRVIWIVTDWYRSQSYYDQGGWRATWDGEGGGVLLNQCPHQLDLVQWLVGLPCKVQGFCHEGKWHNIEVEDDVTAYFEYPNGATGVFITTTADAPGTNRLEITGTKATLICQDGKLIMKKLEMDEREWCATCQEGFRAPSYETIEVETDGQNGQHPAVLNAFAAHILRGEPLVADGREGINGLMLSNAIHLSSWLGHPVTLPIDEKLFLEKLNERRATSRVKTGESVFSDTKGTYGSK